MDRLVQSSHGSLTSAHGARSSGKISHASFILLWISESVKLAQAEVTELNQLYIVSLFYIV